jgi:hypothetical protein
MTSHPRCEAGVRFRRAQPERFIMRNTFGVTVTVNSKPWRRVPSLVGSGPRDSRVMARRNSDTGWSGTKVSRPQLERLMPDANQRKFDAILCWNPGLRTIDDIVAVLPPNITHLATG